MNEIINNGKEVIRIEAEAIADLQHSINEDFVNAVETIFTSSGRVVLTGMGKSGLIARKDCCNIKFNWYSSNLSSSY